MTRRDEQPVHIADRIVGAVESTGAPACVGLDPVHERLPASLRDEHRDPVDAIEVFCRGALAAIDGVVGIVKVQSACFERYGAQGIAAMQRLIAKARGHGFIVVLDAKRGDIGISARHYAAFAFDVMNADLVTLNPYLGPDTIEPFLDERYADRGVFALVRTSNERSDEVQSRPTADGRTVAELIADVVRELGGDRLGACGFSAVGAVVAATKPADAEALRSRMPEQIFLVPGFGAQGGDAESVRGLFRPDGRGAIVTASRSVLFAFTDNESDWRGAIRRAAQRFVEQVTPLAAPRA